jgi:tetratricopeptide (TPR) repeat protein
MDTQKTYSLEDAHVEFAKRSNGRVWELLDKPDRTEDEDEEMVLDAHASLYHWSFAGTEVHRQRGEWMIARVYTVLGEADQALKHANRCLELTERYKEKMRDFDVAYAHEGISRALALKGNREEAREYLDLARSAGEKISGDEDKEIFMGDLNGGEWYGIK